jgi:hypothetical protein
MKLAGPVALLSLLGCCRIALVQGATSDQWTPVQLTLPFTSPSPVAQYPLRVIGATVETCQNFRLFCDFRLFHDLCSVYI